jgi:prepilin-type N-terminal cleavage/methylation domain-containing protein
VKTRSHSCGGFTLIEMIITLCVFLLLASAVFSLFDATLESASSLQDNQARSDQADAMGAWLKKVFSSMPPNAQIVSLRREGVPFDASDIVWGTAESLNALDLHLQNNGLYTLRFAASAASGSSLGNSNQGALAEFSRQVLNDEPALPWRDLMRDLKMADWRFRSQNNTDWVDVAPGDRQLLVQFSFQLAASRKVVVDDCWIPPVVAPPGVPLTTPTSVTASP